MSSQPVLLIFAVNMFNNMRYYNVLSNVFGHEGSTDAHRKTKTKDKLKLRWNHPTPESWIKINVNPSKRQSMSSTSISYIMKDNRSNIIKAINKNLGDYSFLVAECEAIQKLSERLSSRIFIGQIDYQVVINASTGR